jgi:cobalt transporter subunit CbtB
MPRAIVRTIASESRAVTHLPALAVLLFGLVVLYGVGFSAIPAVHNAAHDVRHATGFPCH